MIASAGYAPRLLHRRDGSPGAVLCPIPLFAPARHSYQSGGIIRQREKQQQLLHAIADYYQQQYREACQLRGERKLPVIATGHLTTVGASKSDAVRDIYESVRWMPSGAAFPARIIMHRTHSPRAMCRRHGAYPLLRFAHRPALMSAAKANACIW